MATLRVGLAPSICPSYMATRNSSWSQIHASTFSTLFCTANNHKSRGSSWLHPFLFRTHY